MAIVKKRKWIAGADPGKAGAIVLIDASKNAGEYTQEDVVFIPAKVKDGKLNVLHFIDALKPYAKDIVLVVQEHVHAIFGSSAKGSFEFGDANGSLRTVLELACHGAKNDKNVNLVLPRRWQEVAWKGVEKLGTPVKDKETGEQVYLASGAPKIKVDTKGTSSLAAHQVFSDISFVMPRCKKEHDGCVDAALIAYYGRVTLLED